MRIVEIHSGNAVGGDSMKYTFVREQGEALQAQGCEVAYYAVVGKGLRGYLRNVSTLRAKIEEVKPDIVHAHFGLCGMVAVLAVLSLRLSLSSNAPAVVTTFHNGETLNRSVNLLCSFFALFAKHVVYVAQHIYDKCYFTNRHYTIMPCGVTMEDMVITPYEEARAQLGWSPDTKYILFGGSISNTRKNFALLESALNAVGKKNINEDWWLINGDWCSQKKIEVIEMRGFTRAECVLRMCACDCFCLPSLSEGSPQALKEAMACNCPAVATDMADIKHLFGAESGYFVSDFTVESMADCLQQCLSFEGRTNGRKRIEELGLRNEDVAKKLVEIYEGVLNA